MRTGAVHREALSLTKLRASFYHLGELRVHQFAGCAPHTKRLRVHTISNDPPPRFPENSGVYMEIDQD